MILNLWEKTMPKETDQELLTGWKEIAQFCGVRSTKTIRKWAKLYRMPVVYMCKKPTMSKSRFIDWHCNLAKKTGNLEDLDEATLDAMRPPWQKRKTRST